MSIIQTPSSTFTTMLHHAKKAQENAYAHYSHFRVGACIRTIGNHFFSGCNVENSSYPLTQCAEASAIGNMITHGQREIAEILIIAETAMHCPPCGACRQKIIEFANSDALVHMCNQEGKAKTLSIRELLPWHFNSQFLATT